MNAKFDLIHTKRGAESRFEFQATRTEDKDSKVEHKVQKLDKDLVEYRVIKKYPKTTAAAVVVIGLGVVLLWLAQMGVI